MDRVIIPADDIIEMYGHLPEDRKLGVSNLIRSKAYVSVTAHDDRGKDVALDWHATPGMSIHLLIGVILTGKHQYGQVWLDELKSKISRMA